MTRILFPALLLLITLGDGTRQGREGNRAYESGDYARAALAYQEALATLDAAAPLRLRYALQHNLGSSLYRLGRIEEAEEAFARARELADDVERRARAAFNEGNAALARGEFQTAVESFRDALIEQPEHADARFNLEYVLRQIPPPQQGEMDAPDESGTGATYDDSPASPDAQDGDEAGEQEGDGADETGPGEDDDEHEPGSDSPPDDDGDASDLPGMTPEQMTREQAEQILGALQQGEERLLREIQKAPGQRRNVEKDW